MNQLLFLAGLLISSTPSLLKLHSRTAAKLKADAQKVVSIIKGDKAKTQS